MGRGGRERVGDGDGDSDEGLGKVFGNDVVMTFEKGEKAEKEGIVIVLEYHHC